MKNSVKKRMLIRKSYLDDMEEVIEYPALDAVIGLRTNARGQPVAICFTGTKGNPDFYYHFQDTEHRKNFIKEWLIRREDSIKHK